ncbi:I78 family peptidase inhibitor [Sphingomonas changbaiensis]|nr:I78 family peptidase inhibitor [Sphingomonas changbaiensis]
MIRLLLLAALALGPSFAEKTHTARPALSHPPAFEGCDAEDMQALIGHPFPADGADRARDASGSAIVRVVRPGEAVTMDVRADRLTITLDAEGKVVSARCG